MANNIENIHDYRKGEGFVLGDFLLYDGNIVCATSVPTTSASLVPLILEPTIPEPPPTPNFIYYGCIDPTANNYDPLANVDDGSCVYVGCTDSTADNYNSIATIDDGSCIFSGCTDPAAANYNPKANYNDSSCIYPGCTDSDATNYNPQANYDDGSCIIPGCTDPDATNYNSKANSDDGSCDIPGCTDSSATNYNYKANRDDGSCNYDVYGCTDPTAINYNPDATIDDGSCHVIGCDASYIGFSAATGAFDEYHVIHKLKFTNAYNTIDYLGGFNNTDFAYNGTAYFDAGGNSYGQGASESGNHFDYRGTLVPGNQPKSVVLTRPWGNGTFFYKNGIIFKQGKNATTADFSVYYEFTITPDLHGPGTVADGIVFIIQSQNTGVGGGGGGIGYDGITSSIGIKYDTFYNGNPELHENLTAPGYSSQAITSNYIGIVDNGNIFSHGDSYHSCTSNPGGSLILADGRKTYNWVDYFNGRWYVYVSKTATKPATPIINGYSLPLDGHNLFSPCYTHGCTDPTATNYDPTAAIDDGSCIIRGCTDPDATNYNPKANQDNGSCIIPGCTNPMAYNYNPKATTNDGSCNICSQLGWRVYDQYEIVNSGSVFNGQLLGLYSPFIVSTFRYITLDLVCYNDPAFNIAQLATWATDDHSSPAAIFPATKVYELGLAPNPDYPSTSIYKYIVTNPYNVTFSYF